jgi:hypothetical protein
MTNSFACRLSCLDHKPTLTGWEARALLHQGGKPFDRFDAGGP